MEPELEVVPTKTEIILSLPEEPSLLRQVCTTTPGPELEADITQPEVILR